MRAETGDEETPLLAPRARGTKKDEGSGGASAIFLIMAVFVGAFVLFNNGLSPSKLGISSQIASRIQMAKDGSIEYTSLSEEEQLDLFEEFQATFDRKYETKKEEKSRYKYFLEFLEKVDERNAKERKAGGTAVHGLTMFADMSDEEFRSNYLGYSKPKSDSSSKKNIAKVEKYKGKETSADWRGVYTTDVNNQGVCGSCWAFSVAEQVESDSIRAGLLTTDDKLSAQQIVSCDNKFNDDIPKDLYNYGCQGGNTEQAYDYITYAGGIALESDYEYTSGDKGITGTCRTKVDNKVTVTKYYTVDGEDDMINYVMSTGPLSVCLDASEFGSYLSGVVSSCGKDVDHCVQVVGVDTENGYWIVRNSWGSHFGQDGYIYLKTDQDTCAITTDPTYAEVAAV